MSSSNNKVCVQKRVLDFLRTNQVSIIKWIIVGSGQIVLSFVIGYYFLMSAEYPFIIPAEQSNRVLDSLLDVFIALFGFVGLILVFTFRNLLTTKGNLKRERLDVDLKISQLKVQSLAARGGRELEYLQAAKGKCVERIKEIGDGLARNKKHIGKASYLGFMSLGIAVVCVLMDVWAFTAVTKEGLHFGNIVLLLSLLFLTLDLTFSLIRTAIK